MYYFFDKFYCYLNLFFLFFFLYEKFKIKKGKKFNNFRVEKRIKKIVKI